MGIFLFFLGGAPLLYRSYHTGGKQNAPWLIWLVHKFSIEIFEHLNRDLKWRPLSPVTDATGNWAIESGAYVTVPTRPLYGRPTPVHSEY